MLLCEFLQVDVIKGFEWSHNNEKQRHGRKLHEAIGFGVLTAVKSCSLVGGVVFLET